MKIVIDATKPLDPDALETMGQWFGVRGEPGNSLYDLMVKRTSKVMISDSTFFERFMSASIPVYTEEGEQENQEEMEDERETETVL